MANNSESKKAKNIDKNSAAKVEKNNDSATNSVGSTRRYVSGDEEKSSSSHQFHKS